MTPTLTQGANMPADENERLLKIVRKHMASVMSDISEEHYAAGWLSGLEYDLWQAVEQLPEPYEYGMGTIDVRELEELKQCSEWIGEWAFWCRETGGVKFIPLDEWKQRVAKERK